MSETIGMCIGEASPTQVMFVSKKKVKIGEFVVLEYEGSKVLGMIQALIKGSLSITEDIYDPRVVEKIKSMEGEDFYIKGSIKILGDLENLKIPRIPPTPGTEVKLASSEDLRKVFGQEEAGVKIGSLVTRSDVPVYLDINKLVSRHLAILAITGYGKSNTVAVLCDEMLRFNGSILIFDMHSEYTRLPLKNGSLNIIPTKINPFKLSFKELAILADINPEVAFIQYRYLRMAMAEAKKACEKRPSEFFDKIVEVLEGYIGNKDYAKDKNSIIGVIGKIESLREEYANILDFFAPKILEALKIKSVNVIDLGSVDEECADVIVSHILRNILESRRNYKRGEQGLSFPIFLVLEEAHVLAPYDKETLSKYWIGRIAREGRKFGIGLCLVSQRPKRLDSDSLSQANNMIILKLVEPSDQRYVQQASEVLSQDLLEQLPSLNVGEAVIIGPCIKVPALVKIDEFEGKLVGTDPNVKKEWEEAWGREKREEEDKIAYFQEVILKERERKLSEEKINKNRE
ncbi:MAG: ATP-binding protein [Candidatus Aenigmatarchaeota archaeon]